MTRRATSSENSTAAAAVQPNSRKNLPGMPGMNATGMNTAASVQEVATTARPISSAASSAACRGGLPMRRWRSMFSTSTIASSTRMPTTTASASRVIMFRLKPSQYITAKVGMIDSGSATAEMKVARQSRRNNHTTSTASSAPSHNMCMEASNEACASWVVEATSTMCSRGCSWPSACTLARTALPTSTSLEPLVRCTAKPITGLPSRVASWARVAWPSCTSARVDRRTLRPSGTKIG